MTSFIAMEPVGAPRGEETRFVPDRFALLAFLAPVVWLLWHALWLEALLALTVTLVLANLATVPGYAALAAALAFLFSLLVALESASLRINALKRRGWREAALVEAQGRPDAEIRYFAGGLAEGPAAPPRPHPAPPAVPARTAGGELLGLLDYPGAR